MKRREIFIELTSLLDVILIMIFVLLTQARGQTAEAMDKAKADRETAKQLEAQLAEASSAAEAERREAAAVRTSLEEKIDGLEEEVDALGRQLLTKDLVIENSLILTLSVSSDAGILLERSDTESARIQYDWNDENYAYNRLRTLMLGHLDDAGEQTVFIVLQYDRSRIYKNEYNMILRIVQEIKLEARQREIPLSFIEMDVSAAS